MSDSPKFKVSLFNSPQANDDDWSDGLEDTIGYVNTSDLLLNDLGGEAKAFYGLYDAADPTAASQTTYTELGANLTVNPDGTISYDATEAFESVIQTLAAGETIQDSFEYIIQLADGTLSKAVVYVTVTGENDAPVIAVGVGDSAAATLAETDAGLAAAGTLTVTDADLSDAVTATVQAVAVSGTTAGLGADNAALLAMLTVTGGAIAADPGDANNLAWSFASGGEAFDYLDDGEELVLAYTVRTTDDSGAFAEQVVEITVTGTNDGIPAIELSEVELDTDGRGFVINGVSAGDLSGWSVSGAGDVNGDGFDDLIVGAPDDDNTAFRAGASFVVFGKTDGIAVELSDIEAGIGGFVIDGVSGNDYSGISVSSAGDVNGDGFDDLIVGASGDDPNGSRSGASFVVFGKTDGTAVELSDVEAGAGGFVINGVAAGDVAGTSVSA